MKLSIALGILLGLVSIGCGTDDPTMEPDVGVDQATQPDLAQDLDSEDMTNPEVDMAVVDMAVVDMAVTDMLADVPDDLSEDMSTQDMTQDAPVDMPQGDSTCLNAMDVTTGGVFENQTTIGAGENYDALPSETNCPNGRFSGEERVYVVEPLAQTSYTIRVVPDGNFDPFIYVRTDCNAAACVAGTVLNGEGDPESLTFDAAAGVPSFIMVDGELGSAGTYQLTVTIN